MARQRSFPSDHALVAAQFDSLTRAIPNVFLNLILMTGIFCWFVYNQIESDQALSRPS